MTVTSDTETIYPGTRVIFTPKRGKRREGIVTSTFGKTKTADVQLDGDPFPVELKISQLSSCKDSDAGVRSNRKLRNRAKLNNKNRKDDMPKTTERPKAKELRKQCQALGVKGWEKMGRDEMERAIKEAQAAKNGKGTKTTAAPKASAKRTSKKTGTSTKQRAKTEAKSKTTARKTTSTAKPAKKAAKTTKKAAKAAEGPKVPSKQTSDEVREERDEKLGRIMFAKSPTNKCPGDVIPFRKSSNMYLIAKLLLKGGVRSRLAQELANKVELHPYGKDEVDLNDYDKRLLLGAQTMRDQFGFGVQRVGRGIEGKILVFAPGGPKDPRKDKRKAK